MVCPCGSNTDGFSVTNTLALIQALSFGNRAAARLSLSAISSGERAALTIYRRRHAREDPFENGIDVPELVVEVERLLDFGGRQDAHDIRIGQEERLEVALLVERPHGVALHPLVCLLARDALARQLQQHRPGEHDTAG